MSSRVRPILAHRWPPLPADYLQRRFASDARNGLMRAPSRICVMLRSEGVSLLKLVLRGRTLRGLSRISLAQSVFGTVALICVVRTLVSFLLRDIDQNKYLPPPLPDYFSYCRFGDYKCRYSHSRDHLAQEDIGAISTTLASSDKAAREATKVSPDVPKTKAKKKAKKTSRGKAPAPAANRYAQNFGGDFDWDIENEMEERMDNYGFTEDDMQELLCQGVNPWDDDAMDVLDVLYDYY
ncbi:hypothetical protein ARMSODRAFT_1026353 [Armillaria solidipes]|uniref:C3H1-type domain-containing protein n=1 Tax=Armillaria solidipes TaxID=1076256 RepID=A0A2H3AV49_9AGAR|nr:hypothetical protein ARMSODRAFT_1026353 [Armillaria solidipes]